MKLIEYTYELEQVAGEWRVRVTTLDGSVLFEGYASTQTGAMQTAVAHLHQVAGYGSHP